MRSVEEGDVRQLYEGEEPPNLLLLLSRLPRLRREYRLELREFRIHSNCVRLQIFSLVIIVAVVITLLFSHLDQALIRLLYYLLTAISAVIFIFTTYVSTVWPESRPRLKGGAVHLFVTVYILWLTFQLIYGGDVRAFVTYAGGLIAIAAVYSLDPLFFILLSAAHALLLIVYPNIAPTVSPAMVMGHLPLVLNLILFAVVISLLNYLITLELLIIKKTTENKEGKAELALEGGNLGYWYWDIEGEQIEVDGRWFAMLGYPRKPGRITFEYFFRMIHPDDRSSVARAIQEYMDGKTPTYHFSFRMTEAGGGERWIHASGSVTEYDERGKPRYMHGIHQDVQQLRSQQIQLAESEERFKTYTENAPVGVCIVERGDFHYVNPETIRISGYSEEELLGGVGLLRLIHPEDRSKVLTELKRLYRNRQVKDEYLFRIISRSGRIHWIESRVAVLNWRRMRLLISAVDVSEREAAQSKLQAYATYDELTGIYNRRVGLALLEKEMHRAERERIPLSVCYMDVNGLKWVNDHFGHSAGDQLLLEVVQGIIDAMRKGDVVCRLGGDEFLGIFPQCNTDNAEKIWQRIEERYVAMNGIPGRVYYISVSHGITEYSGEEGCTVEELLRDTDLRMYEEKRRLREGKKEV